MSFCWSSFVSGGYKNETKISKFVKDGSEEECPFWDFKNHYLTLCPSCTPDIESILRGPHGQILTEKKLMRSLAYDIERIKKRERDQLFSCSHINYSSSYGYRNTRSYDMYSISGTNHLSEYLDVLDNPDDPILIDYTHYYYKVEDPGFGFKSISLIKRSSGNEIYYVMVYSFLNYDVASMFLEELFKKKNAS